MWVGVNVSKTRREILPPISLVIDRKYPCRMGLCRGLTGKSTSLPDTDKEAECRVLVIGEQTILEAVRNLLNTLMCNGVPRHSVIDMRVVIHYWRSAVAW